MSHPLFGPEIRSYLAEDNGPMLAEYCDALHPATLAEALEDFAPEEVWKVLRHASVANQATIFAYFPIEQQVEMASGAARSEVARLIEEMSSDDRADLLRQLPPPVTEALLRLVDEADRRDIASLAKYPEGTAGAIMTTDYAWLPDHITAAEALERLRLQAPDKETIYYVYVVDDQRRLHGVVSLRDLIMKPRTALLKDFMEDRLLSVRASEDREKVAEEMAHYDLLALPVVDDDGKLVGIITHDDVMDVVVEEATEDVHRMGAVGPLEENYLEAGFVTVWRNRAFWLSCLFIGGIFTVTALGQFQDAISEVAALTLFIPLCISTGGNSGSQAATLITRALALGQVDGRDWWRVLRHELVMGLALGLTLGVIGFLIAVISHGFLAHPGDRPPPPPVLLGLVIFQAVVCICLWGTLVGSMLPLVFRRFGIDPGIASSPFVATLVDVTGILIYFTTAYIWIL